MTIGIITWRLNNFGTALQAYALVSYVEEFSSEKCRLLNYSLPPRNQIIEVTPKTFISQYHRLKNRIVLEKNKRKNKKIFIRNKSLIDLQQKEFAEFYKSIPSDSHEVSKREKEYFDTTYRLIIVGSDQVWNPKYFCQRFFLDFTDSIKVSYGPSIGVSKLNEYEKDYLKDSLRKFRNISIREKLARNYYKICFRINRCFKWSILLCYFLKKSGIIDYV